jgi:hypothetical protein
MSRKGGDIGLGTPHPDFGLGVALFPGPPGFALAGRTKASVAT